MYVMCMVIPAALFGLTSQILGWRTKHDSDRQSSVLDEQHLLSSIGRMIDNKLDQQRSSKPTFRRKGNEVQFDLNVRLEKRMRSVLNCISSPDMDGASSPIKRNLKRAYSECRDAVDDLSHRRRIRAACFGQ